jgi:O-antigen/teichoic acid export membrane protein
MMSSAYLSNQTDKDRLLNLKSSAIKGAGTNVIAQMISLIANTLGVIVLARLLDPRDFGLVTMVTTVYLIFCNFGINGFTEFIIQKQIISTSELNIIFWLHGILSFCLMLIFIATIPLISAFYVEPRIKPVALVMALGIMVQMLSTNHLAILKRDMKFRVVAVNQVLAVLISVFLAIIMAMKGAGYWAVVARQLSITLVMTIGAWIVCPWRPGSPHKLEGAMDSLRYSIQVYGNFTLSYFARNLDKILLGRYHGSQVLGVYDRAYHLSTMPAEQLVSPLHSVALATLSRLSCDQKMYLGYFRKAISTLAFLGILAGLILTISGKDLVQVLLGPRWEKSGEVVMAFGPGIGIMFIYSTQSWLHLSLGKPERWLRWSIISFGFIGCLFLLAAPFGPVAVALAYSGSFYILLLPALWYAGRPIGLKLIPICWAIGPFLGSGIITWLILGGIFNFINVVSKYLVELNIFLKLFEVILLSTFIYVALVVAFHRSFAPIKEMLSLATTFFSRDKFIGD